MIRYPIINKFTCSPNQLRSFIQGLNRNNILPIIDYINENKNDSTSNKKELTRLIKTYPNNYFALKLSSLNIENDYNNALDTSLALTEHAINNNSKILVDAENYLIQDKIDKVTDILLNEFNHSDTHVYKTYQMYRLDSLSKLKKDISNPRDYYLGIKLVRGAYYNEDVKYNILYDSIEDTHKNYHKGIKMFVENSKEHDTLMVATHNKDSIYYTESLIYNNNLNKSKFEFAQLYGLGNMLTSYLANNNYKVFKYLPCGELYDSVPYLLRRLNENKLVLMNVFK